MLEKAVEMAVAEGITLTVEHVKVLLDLQEYFACHESSINLPITQGCRMAGLKVPPYAKDDSFGTVM